MKLFIIISLLPLSVITQKLLYEPNLPDYRTFESQSLFDKLAPDSSLSTFMDVLTQVEDVFSLLNSTNPEHPFTIFCPTNKAFQKEVNKSSLELLLKQHVIPTKKLFPKDLHKNQVLYSLVNPIQLTYRFRTVLLNHLAIVDINHSVNAVNGIAYKIDHVLPPPT